MCLHLVLFFQDPTVDLLVPIDQPINEETAIEVELSFSINSFHNILSKQQHC